MEGAICDAFAILEQHPCGWEADTYGECAKIEDYVGHLVSDGVLAETRDDAGAAHRRTVVGKDVDTNDDGVGNDLLQGGLVLVRLFDERLGRARTLFANIERGQSRFERVGQHL